MVNVCEVCSEIEAKYKCPQCLKRTCSLKCSKEHKLQTGCDGRSHEPTQYIPNQSFKEADDEKHEANILVQRDYNFLTNIKRAVEVKRRDGKSRNKRTLRDSTLQNTGANGKRGRFAEEECPRIIRRGVNCLVLPRGMQRSMANKSKWDKPLDLFVWTIEWILFPPEDFSCTERFCHTSHRIKETSTLVESMGKVIYDKCREFYKLSCDEEESSIGTKLARTHILVESRLKFYTKWFPYNTMQASDSKILVELNPSKSIAELFRNRTVIEFPTIFISIDEKDLPKDYSVMDEVAASRVKAEPLGSENESDSDDNNTPVEESSKKDQQVFTAPKTEQTQRNQKDCSVSAPSAKSSSEDDSDGYDPGVTMDFLAA